MDDSERKHREDIVRVGALLHAKDLVAGTGGNISVRLSGGRILSTPSGMSKGMLRPEDLVVTNLAGEKLSGERAVTSEIGMHLAIYTARTDVNAVVHAHPPTATGFAAAGRALDVALLPEVIVTLGVVPLAPYGQPGTPALAESLRPFLDRHNAILLENHGAVTFAATLEEAYLHMELVEHFARVILAAERAGGARPLPRAEVEKLMTARARYGAAADL